MSKTFEFWDVLSISSPATIKPQKTKLFGGQMRQDDERKRAVRLTAITDAGMVNHSSVDHSWKGCYI
jgi:hypothetical protein